MEYDLILPSGRGVNLRYGDKVCECGEYVAQEKAGICMRCERKGAKPFFKDEVKPKRGNKK